MKSPPPKRVRPRRLRGRSINVYLSTDEYASLLEICDERGCSYAELVRRWIGRAKPRGAKTPHQDPRQIRINQDGSTTAQTRGADAGSGR